MTRSQLIAALIEERALREWYQLRFTKRPPMDLGHCVTVARREIEKRLCPQPKH